MTQHSERKHALLSASGASRWIACPPSARLQEGISDKSSAYADEGTLAHELAEAKLWQHLNNGFAGIAKLRAHDLYTRELEDAVDDFVDVVLERFNAAQAKTPDAILLLEERLDFSEWVPDGFGTGDVVIIADGVLEVVDLKFGKGVPVSAIGNAQLRLYGLGAYAAYSYLYDLREIHLTIVQPRLDSVSTDEITVEELLEWADTVVKPAAALADAGEGEFKSGDHCRWCKVKATCRARSDENMSALAYEFRDPALLTLDEIGSILVIAEQLKAWAKDVSDYAFDQAKQGVKIPGHKLVSGRSNRVIVDKPTAMEILDAATLDATKFLKAPELLGIGDLEKNIGKKELATILGGLIAKPPGKATLVPETDKRPEINSVDADFAGEGFEEV